VKFKPESAICRKNIFLQGFIIRQRLGSSVTFPTPLAHFPRIFISLGDFAYCAFITR